MSCSKPSSRGALAAALAILLPTWPAQEPTPARPIEPARAAEPGEAERLLDAMEARRFGGTGAPLAGTLAMRGSLLLEIPGRTAEEPMRATFEILFDAAGTRRERMVKKNDYGSMGVARDGIDGDLVWEVHPVGGVQVRDGRAAAATRRLYALVRGRSWRELFESAELAGTERRDGRECPVVRLWPRDSEHDLWVLDPETLLPLRIEMLLPGLDGEQRFSWEYSDWRPVEGVLYPFRERLDNDGVVGTFTYDRIEHGVPLDPAIFAVPEEALKLAAERPAEPLPAFQVVEMEPRHVASIRVEAAAGEVHRTLALLLPEVMSSLTELGAAPAGAPFARFHGERDGKVDLEAGVPVAEPVAARGRVRPGSLPGGKVVIAWHSGSYAELNSVRARLERAIAEKRLVPRGGPWDVYWTDASVERNPKRKRTQLVWPVE